MQKRKVCIEIGIFASHDKTKDINTVPDLP